MGRCRRREFAKPMPQRYQRRRRFLPWPVQLRRHGAQDARGFVVLSATRHVGKRGRTLRAFHQHRVAMASENPRGTVAVPPFQYRAAGAFVLAFGQFQHRRLAPMQDWQQISGVGGNGRAVRDEVPSRKVGFKHRSLILDRYLIRAGANRRRMPCIRSDICPFAGFRFQLLALT